MSREHQSSLTKSHSRFSRVLSLLLLGFIVYGTTVEAAHTHGGLASSVVRSASFSDPATDAKGATPLVGCGDCLICQLHQNFSATLISLPPSVAPTPLNSQFILSTTIPLYSQTTAPRSGRAPPQLS
ncbi:MAG TPA: hypothetical protein VIW64_13135 [Pyrinomonadaceae bacterium]